MACPADDSPDLARASYAPDRPQAGPDPYQPQEPQEWPDQQPRAPQVQPYAPAPQPESRQAPRRPGNRKVRNALIGFAALIGIIVAILVTTAHNSPSTGNVAASTSTVPGAASATASASAPDCTSQAVSWRDSGGKSQLLAVATDLSAYQKAANALAAAMSAGSDLSSTESGFQSAAASLQSDAQAAEANPPPACIPNMRSDYQQALTDYSKGAADAQNAISELSSGSDNVALGDITAANKALNTGNVKFQTATNDLTAFNNS
jgi:hypothetical protein